MTYTTITHFNSNNSRRRGLCGWFFNRKTLKPEMRNRTTVQVIRDAVHGKALVHLPTLVKPSKYFPHVGKKQAAKAKVRDHVAA